MPDLAGPARPTLALVLSLLRNRGLRYTELGDIFLGVGAAVRGPGAGYCVLSVGAGGNELVVNLTIGVLKDIDQNRLAALDACNRLTRDNAAYPYFLHDASTGWDVLMQVRLPVGVVVDAVEYFLDLIVELPGVAGASQAQLVGELGGVAYTWSDPDIQRLLLRSLL